jgi:hypothetical protein
MAVQLIVPVVCPLSGDTVDIPPEELTELEESDNGRIEVVCACGAGGQIERFVLSTVVAADQVKTEDTTRVSWSFTQMTTTAVTKVGAESRPA